MRVAAIDIGTNSVLLLIAERAADGQLRAIRDLARVTRLGQDVDRTRTLASEAIERTLACLGEYADEIQKAGVARLDIVGTSAMRDTGGGEYFVERAAELLGRKPRTISGDEEATLSFLGALDGLSWKIGETETLDAPEVMVVDIGGGSTEFVRGNIRDRSASLAQRASLNFGSVRLYERHVRTDPPGEAELAAVRAYVRDELQAIAPPPPGMPLVGIAGTVTTLAAVAREIHPYDGARVHGLRLGAGEIVRTAHRLAEVALSVRERLPGLDPKRADVIPVGAAIVEAILEWSGAEELVVSDRGVRWGLALELARPP